MSPRLWKSARQSLQTLPAMTELTENVRVHHHLPGVNGEIRIVERPVEHLGSDRLVRGVVVRRKVLVRQSLGRRDTRAGVENEHLLQQVERQRVRAGELRRERHLLPLGQALNESESVLARNRLDNVVRGSAEKLSDDRELVDVYVVSWAVLAPPALSGRCDAR